MMISGLRCSLRSFGILRSVDLCFVDRRFGTTSGRMFKGQPVPEELNLEDRTRSFPETSVTIYQSTHFGHKPRRGHYFLIYLIVPFRPCCLI
jgi:hypothetical protein